MTKLTYEEYMVQIIAIKNILNSKAWLCLQYLHGYSEAYPAVSASHFVESKRIYFVLFLLHWPTTHLLCYINNFVFTSLGHQGPAGTPLPPQMKPEQQLWFCELVHLRPGTAGTH